MIYFLVNNDYHLSLDLKLAQQLHDIKLGLIQVPYSLQVVNEHPVFSNVYCYTDKIHITPLDPFKIFRLKRQIDKDIVVGKEDILMVHTEIDLLNQHFIQKFYDAGARVYLLEDGTASMCYYNTVPQRAKFKQRLKSFLLRNIYGLKYTDIIVLGVEVLPAMPDYLFSGVIVNFGKAIIRNIPLYVLPPLEKPIEVLYKKGAILFSQSIYFWFCTENQYIEYLDELLTISKRFDPFYFKFHPADTKYVREVVIKLIEEKYQNIIILEDIAIESMIEKYPVQYAISFNSTATFNLINKGIIPVFLNNLLLNKFFDSSFVLFENLLNAIDCAYPTHIDEVKLGFTAFSDPANNHNTLTLRQIIDL